jgi:multicomponent K+:H+ antiporter subunit G
MANDELPLLIELIASLLMIAGGGFALVGAIGLVRLRDFYLRLHAPTKASTLGVGGVLLASMVFFGWTGQRPVIHELLITVFVFLTAPIAAHLLVKSALAREPLRRPPEPGGDPAAPDGARPDGTGPDADGSPTAGGAAG